MKLPKGIICPPLTPMHDDESINYDALAELARLLIDKGVDGLFGLGTTGEFYSMSTEEKILVMKILVEASGGRVPVYAGIGMPTTRQVISLACAMFTEKIMIDAISVVTPFFIHPTEEQLFDHYKKIAENQPYPVIIYNIPSCTGIDLSASLVKELSEIENIIGVKDSSGKLSNLEQYCSAVDTKSFAVLSGSDELVYNNLLMGGAGAVCGTANVIPDVCCSLYKNFMAHRVEEAAEDQKKILSLCCLLQEGVSPGLLKQIANATFFKTGPSRRPVTGISPARMSSIKEELKAIAGITFLSSPRK